MRDKITKERVKTLLHDTYEEFNNEIDDIDDVFGKEITEEQIGFAFEFLYRFIDKVNDYMEDILED